MAFSQQVKNQQIALNKLGAHLATDGIMGPKTKAAMEKYSSPKVSAKQTSSFRPTPSGNNSSSYSPSKSSSSSSTISQNKALQTSINKANAGKSGYKPIAVDGIIGPKTKAAQNLAKTYSTSAPALPFSKPQNQISPNQINITSTLNSGSTGQTYNPNDTNNYSQPPNTSPNVQTQIAPTEGNVQAPTTGQNSTQRFALTAGELSTARGSTGQNVTQLQNVLNQYFGGNLTPDGQYGPKTQQAIMNFQKTHTDAAGNPLKVDGIVGPKTTEALNKAMQAPAVSPVGNSVPGGGTAPELPTGSSNNLTASYFTSLIQQVTTAQQNYENNYQQQLQKLQQDKQAAQQELADIRSQQASGIAGQGAASLEEKQMILDRLAIEEKRFDENYAIAQGLGSKLTDLMTEGNNLIGMISGKTGLQGIRNPRINQAIQGVTAAVGVVQAGLSAANNQMGQAQKQLQVATDTIVTAFTDQIDYYKTLNNFYESQATDASNKLTVLSNDERNFLDNKLAELEDEKNRVQANSDYIQKQMMDPDTALAYATAGVTLNDTPEQIGQKLAKYAYSKELADNSKDMAKDGWTPAIGGKAPAGTTTTQITDSKGNTKTYYKKTSTSSTGGGSAGTVGERQTQIVASITSKIQPGARTPSGIPIIDSNGFMTPGAWTDMIAHAPEAGLNRASFIESFGSYLYIDPKTDKPSATYKLTPKEIKDLGY